MAKTCDEPITIFELYWLCFENGNKIDGTKVVFLWPSLFTSNLQTVVHDSQLVFYHCYIMADYFDWLFQCQMSSGVLILPFISVTSLLAHTVAYSTKLSLRPKTNNQPIEKFLKSCSQLSKSCQKLDVILETKVVELYWRFQEI